MTAKEVAAVAASQLPIYTVLVPLYKEANVAEGIVPPCVMRQARAAHYR